MIKSQIGLFSILPGYEITVLNKKSNVILTLIKPVTKPNSDRTQTNSNDHRQG
jgi:hypothetical protein